MIIGDIRYHVYKDDWNPDNGDIFGVEVEETNFHNRFVCTATTNGHTVGHVPQEFYRTVYYFIKNDGMVRGSVTGKRRRSAVHMKGLEMPCIYEFTSEKKKISTLQKLLRRVDLEPLNEHCIESK